jgi:transcriptional regulator of arginine metabolism
MKNRRQEKILQIINAYDVDTQEELIERLGEAGFATTQATVSRDIRELKLSKVMTGAGTYRYVRHAGNESALPHINGALTDSITRIEPAGNILVIHTFVGMAQAIAAAIDALKISDIVGCVAGDDTIIAVIRTEEQAKELAGKIRLMMRGVK